MNRYLYAWRGFKPTPQKQAYYFLQFGLFLVLVIEGADKFFNVLANWETYLPGVFLYNVPFDAKTSMEMAGVLEIIIALLLIYRPKIGAYLSAGMFAIIILMLAMIPGYFNIIIVDFGLFCASLALAKLSQ